MLKFNILLYNFFKIDPKIFVDSCRYYIFERILFSSSFFKTIDHHSVFLLIHDPVLPDSCILVLIQLSIIIHLPAGRRNDFKNPIRRSMTSFFSNLIFITNHTDCRQLILPSVLPVIHKYHLWYKFFLLLNPFSAPQRYKYQCLKCWFIIIIPASYTLNNCIGSIFKKI